MTSYTTKGIPEGMWIHWRRIIPHDQPLGPRSIRLYAADVACHQKHDVGLIEKAINEAIIDEQDIQRALDLDKPDGY